MDKFKAYIGSPRRSTVFLGAIGFVLGGIVFCVSRWLFGFIFRENIVEYAAGFPSVAALFGWIIWVDKVQKEERNK